MYITIENRVFPFTERTIFCQFSIADLYLHIYLPFIISHCALYIFLVYEMIKTVYLKFWVNDMVCHNFFIIIIIIIIIIIFFFLVDTILVKSEFFLTKVKQVICKDVLLTDSVACMACTLALIAMNVCMLSWTIHVFEIQDLSYDILCNAETWVNGS